MVETSRRLKRIGGGINDGGISAWQLAAAEAARSVAESGENISESSEKLSAIGGYENGGL